MDFEYVGLVIAFIVMMILMIKSHNDLSRYADKQRKLAEELQHEVWRLTEELEKARSS